MGNSRKFERAIRQFFFVYNKSFKIGSEHGATNIRLLVIIVVFQISFILNAYFSVFIACMIY